MENKKISSFTDLKCWQEAHKLVLSVYKTTKIFPPDEKFGLTNQIQRATVSVTSNIAEGFARKSIPDKKHFYYMALGSLTEVQNQLLIARDLEYIINEKYIQLSEQTILISKLLNGLIKSMNK